MMANEAKRGKAHVMMPGISGLYIKKIASLSLRCWRAQHGWPSASYIKVHTAVKLQVPRKNVNYSIMKLANVHLSPESTNNYKKIPPDRLKIFFIFINFTAVHT